LQLKEQAQAQAQAQALANLDLKKQAEAQALAISQQGNYFASLLAQITALVGTSPQALQDVQAVQVPQALQDVQAFQAPQASQDVQAAQDESFARISQLPLTRESSPNTPQGIIIQRYPEDLLQQVQKFNGESSAAAISFICAADKSKKDNGESTRRMRIACSARFIGRASQWYKTVTSSDLRPHTNQTSTIMVDLLLDTPSGWKTFSDLFLAAFTSSTETFDLRNRLKNIVWNPAKDNIKVHMDNMKTIIHQMTLLSDQLTDRDKTEYFMMSLANKLNLVKKIDLSRTFDKTCHDIVNFAAKEKYIATIKKQHHHNIPPGLFNLNTMKVENIDYDSDQESLWNTRDIIKQGPQYDHQSPPSQEFDFDSDEGSANFPAPWSRQKRKTNLPSTLPLATTSRNDWCVSKRGFPTFQSKTDFPGELQKDDILNISTDP
jgi:hypothetical protein